MHFSCLAGYINVAFSTVCLFCQLIFFPFLSFSIWFSSSVFMFISARHVLHWFTEHASHFTPAVAYCRLQDASVKYQTHHHKREVVWERRCHVSCSIITRSAQLRLAIFWYLLMYFTSKVWKNDHSVSWIIFPGYSYLVVQHGVGGTVWLDFSFTVRTCLQDGSLSS